jgi:pentatricopeptide repeat protein
MANALLNGYAMTGNQPKVDEFFNEMTSSRIKPNDATYGIVINCHLKAGGAKQAFKYLKELKQGGKAAGDSVYASFLKYFITTGSWDTVDKIYNEISATKIGDNCASLMVRAFGIRDDAGSIETLSNKLAPETHPQAFRDLLMYYLRTGNILQALDIYQEMMKVGTDGQFAYSVSSLIGYYARYFSN